MPTADLVYILIGFTCFIAYLIVTYFIARRAGWKWDNVLYFPFMVFGVIGLIVFLCWMFGTIMWGIGVGLVWLMNSLL